MNCILMASHYYNWSINHTKGQIMLVGERSQNTAYSRSQWVKLQYEYTVMSTPD